MDILTQREQELEDRVIEKVLLMIPEVIGNLITHHMSMKDTNQEFYKKHSELVNHKEVVAKVLEKVEGENPLLSHQKLLEKALPKIQEQVKLSNGLSMDIVDVPSLDYNGEF